MNCAGGVLSVHMLGGKQRLARGNWNIKPVVGGEGPGEGITAPCFGGSEQLYFGVLLPKYKSRISSPYLHSIKTC